MGYRLGIDLGTTFTAAAVLRDGRPEVFPLADHGLEIPSVVLLRPDGTFAVGHAAERQGLAAPSRLAREFKRRIGDGTSLRLAGTPCSAHGLTAVLLRWVVQQVTQRESEPPDHVVVTHPANWGPYKRELLLHATTLADLEDVQLCSEPEAAAMHYASLQRLQVGDVVAVYDLGGGTFDTAVLARTEDGFELLGSPVGIEQLGGVDFDDALFHHVLAALGDAVQDIDPADETAMAGVARLRRDCVLAKEALSEDPEFSVPVNLPGLHTQVRLTRGEFEDLIRPPVVDTVSALRRALRGAQVEPEDVSAVLLAGGSSRIPLVAATLSAELGRPVSVDAHPKHLVALGAARYGAATTPRSPVVPAPLTPQRADDDRASGRVATEEGAVAATAASPGGGPARGGDGATVVGPAPPPAPVRAFDGEALVPHVTPDRSQRSRTGLLQPVSRGLRSSITTSTAAARAASRRVTSTTTAVGAVVLHALQTALHALGSGTSGVARLLRRSLDRVGSSLRGITALLRRSGRRVRSGLHGVVKPLGSTVLRLRSFRPSIPVVGAMTSVLVVAAVVAALGLPDDDGEGDGDIDTSATCPAAPGVGDDAHFTFTQPLDGGEQFHLQGDALHTWRHDASGRLDVVTSDADDRCYAYGEGRWGVADVSGDGRPDLVHVTSDGVHSWIARGAGAYDVVRSEQDAPGEDGLTGLWGAADVDGDADADLVHITAAGVSTWTGDSEGGFTAGAPQRGPRPDTLEAGLWRTADVDGAGGADLVHVLDTHVETWLSRADGGPLTVQVTPAPYRYFGGTWLAGDVTSDARADLVHVIRNQVEPDDPRPQDLGAVVTWVSNGDGTYQAYPQLQEGAGRAYPYEDGEWFLANADAAEPLELLHQNGAAVTTWRYEAQGQWARQRTALPRAREPYETVRWQVGDLQGDGRADVVQVWRGGIETWTSGPGGTLTHASVSPGDEHALDRGVWLRTAPIG